MNQRIPPFFLYTHERSPGSWYAFFDITRAGHGAEGETEEEAIAALVEKTPFEFTSDWFPRPVTHNVNVRTVYRERPLSDQVELFAKHFVRKWQQKREEE